MLETILIMTLAATRIMPLGDSKTVPDPSHGGYVFALAAMLPEAEFVGSVPATFNGDTLKHEGHSGFTSWHLWQMIVPWVMVADPDIVLLEVGTNDVNYGQSAVWSVMQMAYLIGLIQMTAPEARIIFAECLPARADRVSVVTGESIQDGLDEINAALPMLAETMGVEYMPWSDFDPSAHTDDGIHPNAAGAAIMATNWFDAIDEPPATPAVGWIALGVAMLALSVAIVGYRKGESK